MKSGNYTRNLFSAINLLIINLLIARINLMELWNLALSILDATNIQDLSHFHKIFKDLCNIY